MTDRSFQILFLPARRPIGSTSSIGGAETTHLNRVLHETPVASSALTKHHAMARDYAFASPFADFAAPTPLELIELEITAELKKREFEQQSRVQALLLRLSPPKQPTFSHAVSFASPESDTAGPITLDVAVAEQRAAITAAFPTSLSFGSPFADAMGHHPADASVWAPAAGAPLTPVSLVAHPSTLSFASPETDFAAAQADELAWAMHAAVAFDDAAALSFSSPESDFCAVHVAAAAKPTLRVSISRGV